jgi:endoglucanase
MIDIALLKRLSDAVAVAGDESEVRAIVLEVIKGRVTDITIDAMGNITGLLKGSATPAHKIMLCVHLDEPGFMVTGIDDDGLIHVHPVGELDLRYLGAKRVLVGKARQPGAFLWAPIHKSHGKNDLIDVEEMTIDVGVADKGGVSARLGERAALASTCTEFGEGALRGKAFASRAPLAVLLSLITGDPLPCDVALAFTTQDAVGQRGAVVAAYRLTPETALVLNGIATHDLPLPDDAPDRAPHLRLGGGPVFSPYYFGEPSGVFAQARTIAEAHGHPYQVNIPNVRTTAGGMVALARKGVPTLGIGIPVRYPGSPTEVIQTADLETMARLLPDLLGELAHG